jgi:hypothetical protein
VDFTHASRWRQSVKTMEAVTPGPLRAGTVIRTTWDVAGEAISLDLEVAACERPSLWRHTVDEHDFFTTVEYRFEADGPHTRVTMRMDVKPKGWHGWISLPLLSLHRGRMYREQLPQLKNALEG